MSHHPLFTRLMIEQHSLKYNVMILVVCSVRKSRKALPRRAFFVVFVIP